MNKPGKDRILLLALFAGSGCAALIYELVWYQELQLAIGSQSVCLGFLLATFMGGLCLGSLALPRYAEVSRHHPLRVYAAIEAATGVLGLVVLYGMPWAERAFFAASSAGLSGMLLRGVLCAVCLLPPTILMGASLPALVRWVEASPEGVAWWGLLYGGNIAGAVVGCLAAGFYFLRVYDMAVTTWVAVAVNLIVAGTSWWLASRAGAAAAARPLTVAPRRPAPQYLRGIYISIALSGATALGAEVVWTRQFGMLLGATVYAFSLILATFLLGLGLGSAWGAALGKRVNARLALGWSQILLVLGIAWTAWMIADSLPYWPINPLLTTSPWFTFQMDWVRCLWAILPVAVIWGASFPLALAAAAGDHQPGAREAMDPGAVVGQVYAANTLGGIVGALAISLWLIPTIGTLACQRLLIALAAFSGVVILGPAMLQKRRWPLAAALAMSLALTALLGFKMDPIPGELIAYGRRMAISAGSSHVLTTVEGRNSSIAITQWNDGATEIDVNGHVEATTEPYDMKLQRMVGHLPALLHPNPRSVLGIGFGAGVSAGTFTRYPGIQKITICEIEPMIPPTSTRYFADADYDVKDNPRTHIVFDDARHFMLTTREHFDVIASDPLDVFVKGTAAIYSREYFQSVRDHLNPGGMFTLYVPLYESDVTTVRSELATFFDVFPYASVWGNTVNGQGYDLVVMGQTTPLRINLDQVQERLNRPDYAPVARSLGEIGAGSAIGLFSTFAGTAQSLAPWTQGAPLNRDADLRLQYLGGWGINSTLEDVIWRQMLAYRRPPVEIFSGRPEAVQALFARMGGQ
ncbi:MAG TPA: fused MFS/spermidine synthase [Terriglobales bacterium]|nr:fused MFS/spermidine synthase [Terriglobales bacterium]